MFSTDELNGVLYENLVDFFNGYVTYLQLTCDSIKIKTTSDSIMINGDYPFSILAMKSGRNKVYIRVPFYETDNELFDKLVNTLKGYVNFNIRSGPSSKYIKEVCFYFYPGSKAETNQFLKDIIRGA